MPIAIYHLEAKVITRGTGRSAVAAAAYMSCSRIYNDYDGITHDYTRKRGLVWEQIFLPENAPKEWSDRSVLWNAVEASEKSKDSRLARELIVALPKELSQETNEFLLQYFIEKECVAKGMCAHVCYHDTDGHNPHAHICSLAPSLPLLMAGGILFSCRSCKGIASPIPRARLARTLPL